MGAFLAHLHSFLTSALEGSERSASPNLRFNPINNSKSVVGPKLGLGVAGQAGHTQYCIYSIYKLTASFNTQYSQFTALCNNSLSTNFLGSQLTHQMSILDVNYDISN
jgi:hypothetical protein